MNDGNADGGGGGVSSVKGKYQSIPTTNTPSAPTATSSRNNRIVEEESLIGTGLIAGDDLDELGQSSIFMGGGGHTTFDHEQFRL